MSLDREKQKVYEIPVVAFDGGGKLGFSTVRAWVSDVNDNAPAFILPEYKACIHNNLTVNSGFLKVRYIYVFTVPIKISVYEHLMKRFQ